MSQQPEALRLVNEYRPTMPHDVLNSWAQDAKVMIARLHAENETLKLQLLKATTPPMTERAWAEYCLAHRTVDATDPFDEKVRGACNGVAP